MFVAKLFDATNGTSSITLQHNSIHQIGWFVLLSPFLVHQHHTLARGRVLNTEGSLLYRSLESRLEHILRVQWIRTEVVAHSTPLHQKRRGVPGQQPVEVSGHADTVGHFVEM